jgi:hypothetical protein
MLEIGFLWPLRLRPYEAVPHGLSENGAMSGLCRGVELGPLIRVERVANYTNDKNAE